MIGHCWSCIVCDEVEGPVHSSEWEQRRALATTGQKKKAKSLSHLGLAMHKSFSFIQPAGWMKEKDSIPPSTHLMCMEKFPPAMPLYSDSRDTSLPSEYTYQYHWRWLRTFSNRLLVQKLIERLTCVQPACPYRDQNSANPCWTGWISIRPWPA